MLVDTNGDFQGMLSGGCLEGDLAERSKRVISDVRAERVNYDLRGDDDVFGLGVGCEGMLQILIPPLTHATDYEPLTSLLHELESESSAEIVLDDGQSNVTTARVFAPLKLLVLGAGKDAEPLVTFCAELGWQIWVADHRPAAIAAFRKGLAEELVCGAAKDTATVFDLDRFDAAIVMSHNLSADRDYLVSLAGSSIDFVGLLGPPHRRDRLLQEIGTAADHLKDRLRGPVGAQIGGRGPAAIALEIVAELQGHFSTATSL